MKIRDARKIKPAELYERRKQAVLLRETGMTRREIAPIVGVSAYTVGQWIKAWKEGRHDVAGGRQLFESMGILTSKADSPGLRTK